MQRKYILTISVHYNQANTCLARSPEIFVGSYLLAVHFIHLHHFMQGCFKIHKHLEFVVILVRPFERYSWLAIYPVGIPSKTVLQGPLVKFWVFPVNLCACVRACLVQTWVNVLQIAMTCRYPVQLYCKDLCVSMKVSMNGLVKLSTCLK